MRFGLIHIFATVTLFALLIALGTANGAISRDGIWSVESITTEWGGSWSGTNGRGGMIDRYIGKLRDGDRIRYACFGDDMVTPRSQLPQVGDLFVFTEMQIPTGLPARAGPSTSTRPLSRNPTYFAVDNCTLVLPAHASNSYSLIVNSIIAFIASMGSVVLFDLIRRSVIRILATISVWWEQRRVKRDRYRRTHIV